MVIVGIGVRGLDGRSGGGGVAYAGDRNIVWSGVGRRVLVVKRVHVVKHIGVGISIGGVGVDRIGVRVVKVLIFINFCRN